MSSLASSIDSLIELNESDWEINRINNVLNKLLIDNTEKQLKKTFDFILEDIIKKGYLIKISKEEILEVIKKKFKKLGDKKKKIWTKDVAIRVGSILKSIKKLNLIEKNVKEYENIYYENVKLFLFGLFNITSNESFQNNFINPKISIKLLSVGNQHVLLLSNYNNAYSFGKNSFGQLGLGHYEDVDKISRIEYLKKNKVTYISSGYAFSTLICEGFLYSCGAGENGRLSLGSEDNYNIFTKCKINTNKETKFKIVKLGSTHQVALCELNYLWSVGKKEYHGNNKYKMPIRNKDSNKFTKIEILADIKFIQICVGFGGYHTIALSANGNVYTWGHNRVGQLGLGHNKLIVSKPQLVKSLLNIPIKYISAGWGHSAVIDINRNLYICGRNSSGQLGISKELCQINSVGQYFISIFKKLENFKIKFVKCGYDQTHFYTIDGDMYCFGNNDFYKLGCDIRTNNYSLFEPVKVNSYNNLKDIIHNNTFTIILNEI